MTNNTRWRTPQVKRVSIAATSWGASDILGNTVTKTIGVQFSVISNQPRLNPNNGVRYDGTTNLVLTCEGIAGLNMTIKAGSMRDARGRLVTPQNPATVSVNQVHHDQIPMPIPDGASPPFAWTLQPARSTFDPPRGPKPVVWRKPV